MQIVSGLLFALSLCLAVLWGGQTIDYTWGPALLALTGSLSALAFSRFPLQRWSRSTRWAAALTILACGWILWRCWESPVQDFARSDALLAGALLASFLWGLFIPPAGAAMRLVFGGLVLLGVANLVLCLFQLQDPAIAWPFASRPATLPSGLFGHYNHLADFSLVSAMILAARLLFGRESRKWRALLATGAIAAGSCVLISGSRGGLIALGAAACVLLALSAVVAWRVKSRHRVVITVCSIVVPMLGGLLLIPVLNKVQARRGSGESVAAESTAQGFADNLSRLTLYGTAVDIVAEQDWRGGGSRSFGWKKYALWNPETRGTWGQRNDDFVHNELLQTAVDYGWPGALGVSIAVFAVVSVGIAGLMMTGNSRNPDDRGLYDALACGGIAALAGTLLHSNFSFVTHTLPGAMYLGFAMSLALPRRDPCDGPLLLPARCEWIGRVFLVVLAVGLARAGTAGTSAFAALWPVWYGSHESGALPPETAMERIDGALQRWPDAEISGRAANFARSVSVRPSIPETERGSWIERSARLYGEAVARNPFDPEWRVNQANTLSLLGKGGEADAAFEKAIGLQGGMEATFRARYYLGLHLYKRWYDIWVKEARAEEALSQFLRARALLVEAKANTPVSIWSQEGDTALKGVEEIIGFLEGAHILPRDPAR